MLAGLVAMIVLWAFRSLFAGVDPSYDRARVTLALATTAVTLLATATVATVFPLWASARAKLPVGAALAASWFLIGIGTHFLLTFISIVNSCGVDESIPYSWVTACQR